MIWVCTNCGKESPANPLATDIRVGDKQKLRCWLGCGGGCNKNVLHVVKEGFIPTLDFPKEKKSNASSRS